MSLSETPRAQCHRNHSDGAGDGLTPEPPTPVPHWHPEVCRERPDTRARPLAAASENPLPSRGPHDGDGGSRQERGASARVQDTHFQRGPLRYAGGSQEDHLDKTFSFPHNAGNEMKFGNMKNAILLKSCFLNAQFL